MEINSVEELEIEDRLLFIRTDYDFALDAEHEYINFKVNSSLPTIKYAIENGAKVVIASHATVREHKYSEQYSLRALGEILSQRLNTNIYFPENCVGDAVKKIKQDMNAGDVMLLENLMFYKDEACNESAFSRRLSDNIEIYVNEAFGLANKTYSSIVGVPEHIKDKCAGISFTNELHLLDEIKTAPYSPFLIYFAGPDVYPKIGLLEHMLEKIDVLMLGGRFAGTLLKSIGYEILEDGYDRESVYKIKRLYKSLVARTKKVVIPEDFWVSIKTEAKNSFYIDERSKLKDDFNITAVGQLTENIYLKLIESAKLVLWDGGAGYNNIKSADIRHDPISELLIKSHDKVRIISDIDTARNFNFINEKLQISYNIDCAYSYLKDEPLPGLEILKD